MAKVKVNFNSRKAAAKVLEAVDRLRSNTKMNDEITEFVIGRISGEARRGTPLNDDRSFPQYSTVYINFRRRLAQLNRTHPSFESSFSNLTITGQLIDALDSELTRFGLEISVADTRRRPYVTPNKRKQKVLTNKEVDENLRVLGYKLFTAKGVSLNDKVIKRVNTIVLATLRRALGQSRELAKL
jgi:hypothetical protein